jgi:hypothetical protein
MQNFDEEMLREQASFAMWLRAQHLNSLFLDSTM